MLVIPKRLLLRFGLNFLNHDHALKRRLFFVESTVLLVLFACYEHLMRKLEVVMRSELELPRLDLLETSRIQHINSLLKQLFFFKKRFKMQEALLDTDSKQAHNALVTVNVVDKNDWIPNFDSSSEEYSVRADSPPGSIVGKVTAYDQDRDVSI